LNPILKISALLWQTSTNSRTNVLTMNSTLLSMLETGHRLRRSCPCDFAVVIASANEVVKKQKRDEVALALAQVFSDSSVLADDFIDIFLTTLFTKAEPESPNLVQVIVPFMVGAVLTVCLFRPAISTSSFRDARRPSISAVPAFQCRFPNLKGSSRKLISRSAM
jgi:hypothetical protein